MKHMSPRRARRAKAPAAAVVEPVREPALAAGSVQAIVEKGRGHSYAMFEGLSQLDRINVVKEGLPARLLSTLAGDMAVPRETLYEWVGIPRSTANRKVKTDDTLSRDESERTLGIARLVGQVQTIVAESGQPEGFDAARWTADWLREPNNALGGRPPGEFMDTADGRALVAGLIAQMQSGAYA
jgi:putative toxin-antitoxin system antitoxin component (TIGR02293 family)